VSLHHEVYLLSRDVFREQIRQEEQRTEQTNEPKAKAMPMLMLSSQTGQWERREFVPGRCVPDQLYEMVTQHVRSKGIPKRSSEFWRGSLYFPCHKKVLLILHCFERTYDMVELPEELFFGGTSVLRVTTL
jgi:hypothetical protein